ncbi:unnamed protein product [Rotaria magnacalcarata]|uniref:Ammonium transporter AmtB-like domain-containing protein n=2 Tax=Rotaria magnacalcarata TaxID=392030 RepID=A0A818WMP3_9BILA|nr:unnamed protein product [Rotaria magnacalcarata]
MTLPPLVFSRKTRSIFWFSCCFYFISVEYSGFFTGKILLYIGFIFCFWPSFNAGTVVGAERLHAITNTYVFICASVIDAFLMSTIVRQGKLDMIHIQNSTLAGGVAIGTATTSEIGFHGAMIIGTLAGMISVLGFHFILPKVQRIRVHDTCGVNN